MYAFEKGWGWFYWTWVTEDAAQWSWKMGMEAGVLPGRVWEREGVCEGDGGEVNGEGWEGLEEGY